MKVGVLALQGDVPEILTALGKILPGDDVLPVRTPQELGRVGALFLPGGESTTIARLLVQAGLWNHLADRLRTGLPSSRPAPGSSCSRASSFPDSPGSTHPLSASSMSRSAGTTMAPSASRSRRPSGSRGSREGRSPECSSGPRASTRSAPKRRRSPGTGARWSASAPARSGVSPSIRSFRGTPGSTGCSSRRPTPSRRPLPQEQQGQHEHDERDGEQHRPDERKPPPGPSRDSFPGPEDDRDGTDEDEPSPAALTPRLCGSAGRERWGCLAPLLGEGEGKR